MRWFVAVSVLVASGAWAQTIYTWVDGEGTTHYTDDKAQVPQGVRAQQTSGSPVSFVLTDGADAKESPRPVLARVGAEAPVAPKPVAAPDEAELTWRRLFREARERVDTLEQEIALDEAKLRPGGMPVNAGFVCAPWGGGFAPVPGAQVTLGASGHPVPGASLSGTGTLTYQPPMVIPGGFVATPCVYQFNPEYDRVAAQLKVNRRRLEDARTELSDLDRRASFASVPREWRR